MRAADRQNGSGMVGAFIVGLIIVVLSVTFGLWALQVASDPEPVPAPTSTSVPVTEPTPAPAPVTVAPSTVTINGTEYPAIIDGPEMLYCTAPLKVGIDVDDKGNEWAACM